MYITSKSKYENRWIVYLKSSSGFLIPCLAYDTLAEAEIAAAELNARSA